MEIKLVISILILVSRVNSLMEKDLHDKLFKTYNKNVIPAENSSVPVNVQLGMTVRFIDDLNEKMQTISISHYLTLTWKDAFLKWDPEKFDNATSINVEAVAIWRPDIVLDLSLGESNDLIGKEGNVIIYHTGKVTMWPHGIMKVPCKMDLTRFPFDEQSCSLEFYSWSYWMDKLNLTSMFPEPHIEKNILSADWELVNGTVEQINGVFEEDVWCKVRINLHLRRKWLFAFLNTVVPILCIAMLNMLCFVLPCESGERLTMTMSLFLSLAVYMTIFSSTMPETSDQAPVLGMYVAMQLLGSAITIAETVFSLYFYFKSGKVYVNQALIGFVRCQGVVKITSGESDESTTSIVSRNTETTQTRHGDGFPVYQTVSGTDISHAIDRFFVIVFALWNVSLMAVLFAHFFK
ncbi:acetylcholine receptor subunit alpha-type acr-16-like [Mya arenaria]|uniref:acetylcholine receptor subunit alpha-type acr-16-like n=1 Tax=Mya arenaria TaxID=6604 RepID=UPI0022DF1C3F|nr:acetylcholine receptor subunit alpha-type acr-16-like [Mya arenaria]